MFRMDRMNKCTVIGVSIYVHHPVTTTVRHTFAGHMRVSLPRSSQKGPVTYDCCVADAQVCLAVNELNHGLLIAL